MGKMALLLQEMNKFHRWTLLPCTLSSWLCFQLLLHLLFIQSGMLVAVMGLSLERISVPQSGIKGSSVMLACEFRLDEGEKLYSLKWYKDSHEFFSYVPQHPNPIKTFRLPGVQVDSTPNNRPLSANRVVFKLMNLGLNSGGTYKCEILADATFKMIAKESNLTVIVLPKNPAPKLRSFPQYIQLGDRVRGNCSFAKSHPAAKLTFYVNGAMVNNSGNMKVKLFEPQEDGPIQDSNFSGGGSSVSGGSSSNGIQRQYQYNQQKQQTSSSSFSSSSSSSSPGREGMNYGEPGGSSEGNSMTAVNAKTYTSVTGIDFHFERHLFLGQVLNIRCVASVVDQMWDAQTNITLNNYQPPQLSTTGQNRYSSGSAYLVPIFSFLNIPYLDKTLKLGLVMASWALYLC